ncbi:hypothetical protein DD630_02790 [Streptomyces sp. BSE7F]|nr:hypothetical protein DD630_02790 [Streptomyces sp. BSE7F]
MRRASCVVRRAPCAVRRAPCAVRRASKTSTEVAASGGDSTRERHERVPGRGDRVGGGRVR